MGNEDVKKIIVVSDNTGSTAKRLLEAVLVQYRGADVRYEIERVYHDIRTIAQVDRILASIDEDYMVAFTIVIEELRHYFHDQLEERGILHLNVLGPMLRKCKQFLGVTPHYEPGLTIKLDDAYMHRIQAVDFARDHDDGNGYQFEKAELILLGPSRCGKTPLSMYLACVAGLWVGNIPIVPLDNTEKNLERLLNGVDRSKIVALFITPSELHRHRMERAIKLDDRGSSSSLESYQDLRRIQQEIIFCRRLYEKWGLRVVETTNRAYEEVAEEILTAIGYPDIRAIHRT